MPRKSSMSKKPRTLVGRPEHIPTLRSRGRVIEFVCAGFTQDSIALYLEISPDTLRKHYAPELDKSVMMRTSKLARNVYLDAVGGCKASRSFWLTHKGGWYAAKAPEKKEDESPPWLAKFIEATRGTKE